MKRNVVSISLSDNYLDKLDKLSEEENKSRSQLVRELIDKYQADEEWNKIRKWGAETAKKFNIKSEEDILRIIND